jgi:hypothetical protein
MTALLFIGGSGWLVPTDVAAGEVATIVSEGAPLYADYNDHTVIEWMEAGTPVDFFFGPYEGMYQVRYYDIVGWTWIENVARDGGAAAWGGGTGGSSAEDTSSSSGGERWMDVDRSSGMVTLYEGDTAVFQAWAALSRSQGEDYYATASGTYYVYAMNADLTYTEFADAYITHWVGFDPDRRNGFHSWVKDANGSYLPGVPGYSGGCVMLATENAAVVYDFAYIGMRVEVHW